LPHWCTCSQHKVLSNTNERVIDISKQFVGKINEKVSNVSQCEILSVCWDIFLKTSQGRLET
jgi:hypothetical protein